ncbi:hypothetical protein M409DRAFT_67026 [Zasmidium cellare ATCC 36951]|uniref:Uncharacterized protein n=1 Tax=Zasmidium cellare ATCC 36951 TaxID=1080233 RepID=A0A6A6CJM9_ZASCE|nr:uncharacterized protein M409DRAFT_67026 [Zasmidium cellare ATCC 36951]KAF2165626.1 hypothetical protein M409DRAFT_67026 [Zasmidium cellare ATCC 36951]
MASLLRGAAFITGAGSGIGQYTAYALASHGVRQLALCDIRPEVLEDTSSELRKRHGDDVQILNLEMDTSKEDSVNSALNDTIKTFSRLDIAVNNAGIGGTPKPTAESDFDDWQRVMSVNLHGVWLCQRAQIRQMLKQEPLLPPPRGGRGVIVNVASMLGLVASSPKTPACAYTASKHGVVGLTRTDGVTYASQGIRINAMCPGYVATPLLKSATASGVMAAEIAKVPQGRLGDMEEIADSIVYLVSPMSSFMTGATLAVDGGYTAQ